MIYNQHQNSLFYSCLSHTDGHFSLSRRSWEMMPNGQISFTLCQKPNTCSVAFLGGVKLEPEHKKKKLKEHKTFKVWKSLTSFRNLSIDWHHPGTCPTFNHPWDQGILHVHTRSPGISWAWETRPRPSVKGKEDAHRSPGSHINLCWIRTRLACYTQYVVSEILLCKYWLAKQKSNHKRIPAM